MSLDSIVYCFREGLSPESIAESFTTLTLEQVYGAIAFYLANQQRVDEYLLEGERSPGNNMPSHAAAMLT